MYGKKQLARIKWEKNDDKFNALSERNILYANSLQTMPPFFVLKYFRRTRPPIKLAIDTSD